MMETILVSAAISLFFVGIGYVAISMVVLAMFRPSGPPPVHATLGDA